MLTIRKFLDGVAFYKGNIQTYDNEVMFYSFITDKFRYKEEVSFIDNLMAMTISKHYRKFTKENDYYDY